ncbi:hypothetical protein [Nannocystis pusilla]|uniref:hypothetical protein n=1 Tax=Nannocystis pusilla TaxID=889268 RepID=UPI003B76249A
MDLRTALVTLRLRHPFGLSRGTVSELPSLLVRIDPGDPDGAAADGPDRRGLGEASPVRYLGQSAIAAAPLAVAIAAELAPRSSPTRARSRPPARACASSPPITPRPAAPSTPPCGTRPRAPAASRWPSC